MEYIASIFSMVFFLVALISIFLGAYIINLNPRSSINRAFLFLCISLSIWALGFSLANSAQTLNMSIIWRRFAAIGWTTIVSITLHFILLITRKEEDKIKDKFLYLLHIPAFLNMYIFSLSKNISSGQYNLVKNDYGWANITVNNGWDYIYYIYYGLYMVVSLFVLFNWRKRLEDKRKIRQVNLIFVTLFIALVLSSITDTIISTILEDPLPQMGPIFILVPTWAMYYSARYYDVIGSKKTCKEEIIATEEDRRKIFFNIAITFYVLGTVSFIFDYGQFVKIGETSLVAATIKSFMFILTGTLIYLIQKIEKSRVKEILTIIILLVNIPIITFRFLENSSITIWVFPIIIIIASLVFSKKTLLVSTAIVSIITQRLLWILKPQIRVELDGYDYIIKILLILTAAAVGYYVNKIYVSKIEENDYQIRFQKMNAEISSEFISINKENKDEKINELLSKIGTFFQVDRAYVFLINHDNQTMTYSYEWCNEGIQEEVETIEEIPLTVFPWWIDQLDTKNLVYIEDISDMPDEAINEKAQLIRQNVKSLISVPVYGNGKMKGFIGIDSVISFKKWTNQDVKLLTILSNLLSDGLTKIKSEKEIEFMAYYDNLTKLPNRVLFKDRIRNAINLAQRNEKHISIVFIDLDDFKLVNDTMGHSGGDNLLKQIARGLKNQVRKTDTVARFGGDEFMILLNNIDDYKDIPIILDKIMNIFLKTFLIDGQEFFITASVGVATYPMDGEDPETLIKNADIAMYDSKAKGKNQYSLCTNFMKDEINKSVVIYNELNNALEREELTLYYQPQVNLTSEKITGVEALLRWNHPKYGMVDPKVFIPIAEKNGLINSIGNWVLETACKQNKKWHDMGFTDLSVAINLSALQFINPNIAGDVKKVLRETSLDPQYLEIEITEIIAIKETDFVIEVLDKLKEIGISIAIDDFGTEYSSLSRLKILPIDRIKIDMEFIHGIENNIKDQAITKVIINLGKNLGLDVLAEGVETAGQLSFLKEQECDHIQGFYYYKPMLAREIEKVLEESKNDE